MIEPTKPLSLAEAAEAAADHLEDLARHAHHGYATPVEAYTVLRALASATTHLTTVLWGTAQWVVAEADAGRVGHDQYPTQEDVLTEVHALRAHLGNAHAEAQVAAGYITHAADTASHLTARGAR